MERRSLLGYKRLVYLLMLPLTLAAVALAWFTRRAQVGSGLDNGGYFLLVSLSLGLFGVMLLLFPRWLRRLERFLFIALACAFVLRFFQLLALDAPDTFPNEINDFAYWLPVLYAFTFLIFGVQQGSRIALLYYLLMLTLGVTHLVPEWLEGATLHGHYPLVQTYLSSFIFIMLFSVFARFTEAELKSSKVMERLAHTDALTGLHNRRGLEHLLQGGLERAQALGEPLSLILLDIDHFKRINDSFGHDVGDTVLKSLAHLIQSDVRSPDEVGRWGGEEFLAFLPQTRATDAVAVAERLRKSIERHNFAQAGRISASFGVASLEPDETLETLLKRVDSALYRAKETGRNRVERG